MGDIFTTCFCSKGPSSGSTQIKFTVTSYWCMIGLYRVIEKDGRDLKPL